MKPRGRIEWLLHLIMKSLITVPNGYVLEGYYSLRKNTLGRSRVPPEARRGFEENLTFIYRLFNGPKMARRPLCSMRTRYPNTRVAIVDDREIPLETDSTEIMRWPFNSGLGREFAKVLARIVATNVMHLNDMLLILSSRVYEYLSFLRRSPEVDLCGLQASDVLRNSTDVYRNVHMDKVLPIPVGAAVEGCETMYKTANCFVARTESIRKVGWDSNIRTIDHHEFLWRTAGRISCVQDSSIYAHHCRKWFNWRNSPYRNDTVGDTAYICEKHVRLHADDASWAASDAPASDVGRSRVWDVVYLVRCAVDGLEPDAQRVAAMDLDAVFAEAKRHMLASACDAALKEAGVFHAKFREARGMAIRKVTVMDVERGRLFSMLDAAGIWHAPLKGCVLQVLYPTYGIREMSDNDIIFDATRAEEVRGILESMGFDTVGFGSVNVDVYHKEPVCNFEMHRELFSVSHEHGFQMRFHEYYRDVGRLLIPDGDGTAGMHLTDEDFYVYMVAHEYNHFAVSGTGLRSLLDTYVFLRARSDALDWDYVESELGRLGIADFERGNRSLSLKLFAGEELGSEENEMLAYVAKSGTYGTVAHRVANGMRRGGRLGYLLRRALPSLDVMAYRYPVLDRAPLLLPAIWVLHILRSLRRRRGAILGELGEVLRSRPK